MTIRNFLFVIAVSGNIDLSATQPGAQPTTTADWEVSGAVKREAAPLKDVFVRMSGPEEFRAVQTDSQGRYRFKGSLPGTYTIRMEKPDDASEARSRTIRLAPGNKVEGFDLLVAKGAVIAGRVVDQAGQPVSGLVVLAYVRSLEPGEMRLYTKGGAITDDRGDYRIAHLPPGAYLVGATPTIRKPLRAVLREPEPATPLRAAFPPMTFSPGGRSPAAAAVIEMAAGGERLGVDIRMEKVPVYCVYFRPSTQLAGAGSAFRLGFGMREWMGTRGPKVAEGTVTLGQDWQVCGVPQGDYRLDLFGYVQQTMQGMGYGQETLVVGKGHADAGQVQMVGFGRLTGKVSVRAAKPGEPIPDGIRLRLQLHNRDMLPSDTLQGRVAKNGVFDLAKVYSDTYGLQIENLPRGYYVTSITQGLIDVRKSGVRPDAGPIEIELASDGPRLSGTVNLAEKAPPAVEATVFLISTRDNSVRIAQSDLSGTYSFDSGIPPGEYKAVAVCDLPESQRRDPQMGQRFLSHAVTVKLNANEDKTLGLTGRSGN
ncbi:MAG: carboxypeptidase regulatory-like domain-containing protein [Acidobacteria bacterium]|jgi:hypothetical protein|nr:carboxypeptidase regulatory-like domain-containing protein [Acidobacteriota bacterium]